MTTTGKDADGNELRGVATACFDTRGELIVCTTDLGEWSSCAEARDARAALDAALSGGAQASAGVVAELFDFGSDDGVRVRLVCTTEGCDAASVMTRLACLPPFERHDNALTPGDMLLAHEFAGGLRLVTLVVPDGKAGLEANDALMKLAAFGADAHVALRGEGALTDVLLGGVSQDAAALAAMPRALRAAVRDAQKAQLRLAAKQCIEAQWGGGLHTLRTCDALASKRMLDVPLSVLLALLAELNTGGRVTAATCQERTSLAESLEAKGRYLDAAALYKQVCCSTRNRRLRSLSSCVVFSARRT